MRLAGIILALAMALTSAPAIALDPARTLDQLGHTRWTLADGAPTNIRTLAQTPNGYLWIGAERGLYRFDGVTFEHIPAYQGPHLRSEEVSALFAARNGDLWVGHYWGGVSVLRNKRLLDANPAPPNGEVSRIVQTRDGAIWVGTYGIKLAGLRRYLNGRWEIINAGERGLPREQLEDILAAPDGSLWAALSDVLVRLAPGGRTFERLADKVGDGAALALGPDGRVWIADAIGVRPLSGQVSGEAFTQTGREKPHHTGDLIVDRQGGVWRTQVWEGARRVGLVRIRDPAAPAGHNQARGPQAGWENFSDTEGLSSNYETALLEDNEGDVWAGGAGGLDRFRVVDLIAAQRFPSDPNAGAGPSIVQASADGTAYGLWARTLHQLGSDGAVTTLSAASGTPKALCGARNGGTWTFSDRAAALLEHGRATRVIPSPVMDRTAYFDGCAEDGAGRLWLAVTGRGLYVLENGAWRRFDVSPELKAVPPYDVGTDPKGRLLMYFGTRSLYRMDGDKAQMIWDRKQISIRFINFFYSSGGRVLMGGEGGLAAYDGKTFKVLTSVRFPLLAYVSGIAQTPDGDTWILAGSHVLRLSTRELNRAFDDPRAALTPRMFDVNDGLPGDSDSGRTNDMALSGDGRIWFMTSGGPAWVDPHHLYLNALPPPVHIRWLSADGRVFQAADRLRLPTDISSLQIDYTATSLMAPERVRFRYKLDRVDKTWVDAGGRRQAFYSNLPPGHYRFQVIASNNDGVWNTTGAAVRFRVPPTFLESIWFKILCGVAAAVLLGLAYRMRMNQLAARLKLRHEERIAERERIARELHDTLLQSVQGLIFRFQSVASQIPREHPTRNLMEDALDRADEVLAEGRDRVVRLRHGAIDRTLPQILEATAERILAGSDVTFQLTVEGQPRALTYLVGEEVVRIAEEFLFNTVQHANARRVEVALRYSRKGLAAQLSDDGRGIDPEVLERGGREGHFGLVGMRERASKIGAALTLSSRPAAGVELVLNIPASVAFARGQRPEPQPDGADLANVGG
ncbi:MAG TPA: two-component regulator propeller domain-containing protein [Caulobacteraceae bacterium]|jgi:signal transduction histidine kinase/ligand-binding sensor domain-containing protein